MVNLNLNTLHRQKCFIGVQLPHHQLINIKLVTITQIFNEDIISIMLTRQKYDHSTADCYK